MCVGTNKAQAEETRSFRTENPVVVGTVVPALRHAPKKEEHRPWINKPSGPTNRLDTRGRRDNFNKSSRSLQHLSIFEGFRESPFFQRIAIEERKKKVDEKGNRSGGEETLAMETHLVILPNSRDPRPAAPPQRHRPSGVCPFYCTLDTHGVASPRTSTATDVSFCLFTFSMHLYPADSL